MNTAPSWPNLHKLVAMTWNTPEAQAMVERWVQEYRWGKKS